jgi:hypothetical protein
MKFEALVDVVIDPVTTIKKGDVIQIDRIYHQMGSASFLTLNDEKSLKTYMFNPHVLNIFFKKVE